MPLSNYVLVCSNCGAKHLPNKKKTMILNRTQLEVSNPSCYCGAGFDAQIKVMGE